MRSTLLLAVVAALSFSACASFTVEGRARSSHPHHDPPAKVDRAPVKKHAAHPAKLGIPPGHLPSPGKCRIWYPGRPPGHQPKAGRCRDLERRVPPGAWLLYRSTADRRSVRVTSYERQQSGLVAVIRLYDADNGAFIRVVAR